MEVAMMTVLWRLVREKERRRSVVSGGNEWKKMRGDGRQSLYFSGKQSSHCLSVIVMGHNHSTLSFSGRSRCRRLSD